MDRNDAERSKAAYELNDLQRLIDNIEHILNEPFFDITKARELIYEVNNKHADNKLIYDLITAQPAVNPFYASYTVPIDTATPSQLQEDLRWKHFYLNAKRLGKALDEIVKEWRCLSSNQ